MAHFRREFQTSCVVVKSVLRVVQIRDSSSSGSCSNSELLICEESSKLIVQLFKFITRLVYSLKIAIHSFTGVNLKKVILLPSGSFESVPNWLNWGC